MVEWKGTDTIFGFAEGTTWGTAVAVGANHQVPVVSADPAIDAGLIRPDSLTGTPFRAAGLKGDELHSGPITVPLDYESLHRSLAFAFGSVVAPAQQGSDLAYQHEIVVAGSDKGEFVTMVLGHLGVFVKEYPSVKFGDVAITLASGNNVGTAQIQVTPDRLITDDSGANTLSSLIDLSLRVDPAYVEFQHLKVLINDRGGAALTESDDEIFVSGITLNLTKNLRTASVTTRNAPYTDEPVRNGFFDVSGSLQVAELEDAVRIGEVLDKSDKKMHIEAIGGIADGVTPFTMRFEMANVQFDEAQNTNPSGPGVVTPTYTFLASRPAANPAGFSHNDAVRAFIINTDSVAPLT